MLGEFPVCDIILPHLETGKIVAKEKASADMQQVSLESARVKKLVIKNFRCIGSNPVEVDLDDIVVLVGPNNVGKSTLLQ